MKRKAKEETSFMKDGRLLLVELFAFCNEKSNPICIFFAKELRRATNNYDQCQCFLQDAVFEFYKGYLVGHLISVKKFRDEKKFCLSIDIAVEGILQQCSKALWLLLGALETKNPTLVYEFAGHSILSNRIYVTHRDHFKPIPWKFQIRIARDMAKAVAYLHAAFSRPIIHRDINSSKFKLDENNVAKLIDFSLSISIPDGQCRRCYMWQNRLCCT